MNRTTVVVSEGPRLSRPRLALLLGPLLFLAIWVVGLASGLRLDFARDRMMQFVGAEELASVSYPEAWQSLHMQPPGLNMLLKFSDSIGGVATAFWLALLLAGTLVALWMVGDIVLSITQEVRWAVIAGVLAALLPGTLYYSLWVFYTQLAAVALTGMVWGMVTGLVRGSLPGWLAASVFAIPLFLLRSTYVWPVIVAWLITVLVLSWRQAGGGKSSTRLVSVGATVVAMCAVLGAQGATWITFGQVTQSSWGYENAAKALMTQLPPESRMAAAAGDPCLKQVIEVGVFQPIEAYPTCAREGNTHPSAPSNALVERSTWSNGYPNMNSLDRLALSDLWRSFVVAAAADNPLAIARIPFPNLETQERGTILRFLWPSSWYWLIESNVSAGGVISAAWIVMFSWVPAVGLVGILLGLWGVRRQTLVPDPRRTAFIAGSVAVLGVSLAYLFLETGENERFRVEIDWLIVALGATGWLLWRRRSRTGNRDQDAEPEAMLPRS